MARDYRRSRKQYLQRDEGLHAEPDGVDEVDYVRGEGAQGAQGVEGYEAVEVEINIC
jgi:hypothetical protein